MKQPIGNALRSAAVLVALIAAFSACSGATDEGSLVPGESSSSEPGGDTPGTVIPGSGNGTSDRVPPSELPTGVSPVVINEVTSAGDDFIEFYNQSSEPVDLSGWSVLDDNPENERYFFRQGTVIAPGRFIVLVKGDDHQFGIGWEDEVNLYDASGRLVDHTAWPPGAAEVSWCRMPDGTGAFQSCSQQTFGALNTSAEPDVCGDGVATGFEVCDGPDLGGLDCEDFGFREGELGCDEDCMGFDTSECGAPVAPDCEGDFCVVINEVTSAEEDSVEFLNIGEVEVDLSGWSYIDDNPEGNEPYVFPDGTILPAGAYLVRDKDNHHTFGLGGSDEVNLYNAAGVLIDATGWDRGEAVVSWCRIPNGVGPFRTCSQQTFGAPNVP
ncbi:MAG: lamin tail domain-containing protein [Deltaproteobacteria bacterium]|nr:MAG: lamin tail domain-containing protein [Deltaproteobacteria bacterium]